MVVFYDTCPQNLLEWVQKQHLFWVATAPLNPTGHVNVSPKGAYDCFHVINANKIWYEDLTGSGNETISHLRENKRITVMFCAFDGPPRIVRFFGTGTVYEYGTPEYDEFLPEAKRMPGSRAVIIVDVYKVGSSCGYTIPYYDFRANRTMLLESMSKKEKNDESFVCENPDIDPTETRTEKGIRSYWVNTNSKSLDGLPGILYAPYAKTTPKSPWTLEGFKSQQPSNKAATGQETVSLSLMTAKVHLENNAKLLMAFSLGVLLTAIVTKISDIIIH